MIRNLVGLAGLTVFALAWPSVGKAEGDPTKGERIFQRCAVCHGIGDTTKPVGPNLNNVVGRTAGTLEGYDKYSANMKEAGAGGLVWTVESINEYIENPRKMIPRGTMAGPGLRNAQERADVVAYIAQFSEAADVEEDGEAEE